MHIIHFPTMEKFSTSKKCLSPNVASMITKEEIQLIEWSIGRSSDWNAGVQYLTTTNLFFCFSGIYCMHFFAKINTVLALKTPDYWGRCLHVDFQHLSTLKSGQNFKIKG